MSRAPPGSESTVRLSARARRDKTGKYFPVDVEGTFESQGAPTIVGAPIGSTFETLLRHAHVLDIAVIPAAVGRRVLPFVHDEHLVARAVVEEERGHRAGGGIAGGEVRVDDGGRRTMERKKEGVANRDRRQMNRHRWLRNREESV